MTIEEKAKAYDEAYKVAVELHNLCKEGTQTAFHRANLETMFPELAESEDEKIRKTLIQLFQSDNEESFGKFTNKQFVAWLEKQAERKTPQWMIDFLDNYRRKIGCSLDHDEARDVEGKILCIMQWLENQGQVKESAISQHENRTCEENGNSLTYEDGRIRKALKEYFINSFRNNGVAAICGVHIKDILAWLEKQVEERKITHEEICKSYGIPDIGEFSDGYHTFNGLYKQRMILFAILVKTYKDRAWKSWKHEDGLDCFGGGWFIVGIDTPAGTYTYHYEAKDWDRFDCQILEKAKHWDGHDESDVERLFSLVSNTNKDEVIRCLINGMKFYYEDNEEATWGTQKFSMKVKDILDWLEKQKPADKIEPKFYEGDWLIFDENHNSVYQVERIDNYRYYLRHYLGGTMSVHFDNELVRLWTIEDAKDGDVLATSAGAFIYNGNNGGGSCPGCYCGINTLGRFQTGVEHHWTGKKVYPATKEQRDTLLKAMVDAGYTFDFEDKKLKKIEPKTEENKGNVGGISSNWSEEDKDFMYDTLSNLTELKDRYGEGYGNVGKCIDWLKSLKERIGGKL